MYMDADKRITEYKKLNQYTESIAEEATASSATSVNSQKQASFFKDDEQNIIYIPTMTLLLKTTI